jgi:hypothetical protein
MFCSTERKQFFFKKKNQKISAPVEPVCCHVIARRAQRGVAIQNQTLTLLKRWRSSPRRNSQKFFAEIFFKKLAALL